MRQLRAWLLRFKGLFLKDARERELADELESHLQMHIDDNIRAGMSPQEARRVALMKLGGVDQTKEAYRDRATIPFVESLVQDPIGQRFGDTNLTSQSIKEVVGVVDDIREGALDSEIWPAYYYSLNQFPDFGYSVVVRTAQADQSLIPTVADAIRGIDSRINISSQTTMTERVNNAPTVYLRRSSTWLVAGFAAVALLLGVVGLYGVIAYSVSQRTREIGVRIALGAQRSSVYRLILREAGALAVAGIVIGTGCAIVAASLMRKLLFGTPPWDITTLISVAAVLGASALLASFLPARRAASVDPISALRAE